MSFPNAPHVLPNPKAQDTEISRRSSLRELVKAHSQISEDCLGDNRDATSDIISRATGSSSTVTSEVDESYLQPDRPSNAFLQIKLLLNYLCVEEMRKVDQVREDEIRPKSEIADFSSSLIPVFLDDPSSQYRKDGPIFMTISWPAVNIEILHRCRRGLGPRPAFRLDLLRNFRDEITGEGGPRKIGSVTASYNELLEMLKTYNEAFKPPELKPEMGPEAWNRMVRSTMQQARIDASPRYNAEKSKLKGRIQTAAQMKNAPERLRLEVEKRQMNARHYAECAKTVLDFIQADNQRRKDRKLKEYQDVALLQVSAQAALQQSSWPHVTDLVQACEIADASLQRRLEHDLTLAIQGQCENAHGLVGCSKSSARQTLTRRREMFAFDVADLQEREVKAQQRAENPYAAETMFLATMDNQNIQEIAKVVRRRLAELSTTLDTVFEAADRKCNAYMDAYAALVDIEDDP